MHDLHIIHVPIHNGLMLNRLNPRCATELWMLTWGILLHTVHSVIIKGVDHILIEAQ